jgi:hypothetical protein
MYTNMCIVRNFLIHIQRRGYWATVRDDSEDEGER